MSLEVNIPHVLAEMEKAFLCYEQAFVTNDITMLDTLFLNSPLTVRYGTGENLYGYAAIAAFRKQRDPKGLERELQHTVITTYGESFAVTSTEFTREGSEHIGRQSQTWVKIAAGWRIVTAHVSLL